VAEYRDHEGGPNVDPGSIRTPEAPQRATGSLEIVVAYTDLEMTTKVVETAATLAAGLDAVLKLVAVYVAPYPTELRCPAGMEGHLTSRLTKIAERTSLPVSVHLVVSRDRSEGLRSVLRPGSAILVGTRKHFWRTREEKLARDLTRQGHHVSLLHFD
jgi:K+-sensing histidine kinase KdpD